MKQHRQSFPTVLVAILSATLVFTPTAIAQDPTAIAAQAAAQSVAAQQAASQQGSAQGTAPAQAAMDNSTQATPAPIQQAPPPTAPGPSSVPAQIASSHNIFLSNLGADTNFPIDATSVYNAIYSDLQTWGRYQLVGSPEQADLIFQLKDLSTYTTYTGNHGSTYTINSPSFQLTIVDAQSNVTLWTISSPIYLAGSKGTLARWVAISETNLVSRIKVLANQPLSPTETADLTTFPKGHGRLAGAIVLGSLAAMGVGVYLIVHHENDVYAQNLANQKAAADAWCTAHGIPLSECAGG